MPLQVAATRSSAPVISTGAAYEIQLPDKWNGTLLIYSHGYRQAEPVAAGLRTGRHRPGAGAGEEVASALLAEGYALAGSAFKTNGWDVLDGVAADEALHTFFVDKVGYAGPRLRVGRLARRAHHRDAGREAPGVGLRRGAVVRRPRRHATSTSTWRWTWPTPSRR